MLTGKPELTKFLDSSWHYQPLAVKYLVLRTSSHTCSILAVCHLQWWQSFERAANYYGTWICRLLLADADSFGEHNFYYPEKCVLWV